MDDFDLFPSLRECVTLVAISFLHSVIKKGSPHFASLVRDDNIALSQKKHYVSFATTVIKTYLFRHVAARDKIPVQRALSCILVRRLVFIRRKRHVVRRPHVVRLFRIVKREHAIFLSAV